MRISRVKIENFRGISKSELIFSGHTVVVGDNNTGKSTVFEAIDLVLGPERLSVRPIIDEHDFFAGKYLGTDNVPVKINIEVVVIDLSEEQTRYFKDHIEWWDQTKQSLLDSPPPEGTDQEGVYPALRVGFIGQYDKDEDDFSGSTFFASPAKADGAHDSFKTTDKRQCGFLFLRNLRTGARALSLERGSLLDIVLRLKEVRLQMWEKILSELRVLPVAEQPELGLSNVLSNVQDSLRSFVPSEWADNPHMRVSDLTRQNLRKILTMFMGTGMKKDDGTEFSAPFQHQGTGTINILVLALLSMIAELKQNVIFAMEEPEVAIPPHTQKRIINSVCKKSAQALFTSHSPYILEEFKPDQIIVLNRSAEGVLSGVIADYPPTVKPKKYRTEVRTRFCESLLARKVLIVEGRTEYDAYLSASRRLNELDSEKFKTLESLGIAVINADTDSQIAPLAEYFKKLGKITFAVYDEQEEPQKSSIKAIVDHPFENTEKNFESFALKETAESALRSYAKEIVDEGSWPPHLASQTPTDTMAAGDLRAALSAYFQGKKGEGAIADLFGNCSINEIPQQIVQTLEKIQTASESKANVVEEVKD